MPLLFSGVAPAIIAELEQEIRASPTCLLRDPLLENERVEVLRHEAGLVFKTADAYFFARRPRGDENDLETLRAFVGNPVYANYIPLAYELMGSAEEEPTAIAEILDGFANFGAGLTAKIDHLVFRADRGPRLCLVWVPREIVAHMVGPKQGRLFTTFRGRVGDLRTVPALAPAIPADLEDAEVITRVFATDYRQGERQRAVDLHWAIVRQVVAGGAKGVCVGPVAVWGP